MLSLVLRLWDRHLPIAYRVVSLDDPELLVVPYSLCVFNLTLTRKNGTARQIASLQLRLLLLPNRGVGPELGSSALKNTDVVSSAG